MANGLSMSELVDLTKTTLEDLPKMKFEHPQAYQDHPILNRFLERGFKVGSGYQIKRNIVLTESGQAEQVQLYQGAQINVTDVQKQITSPWTFARVPWTIERHEALMNRQPAAYVELVSSRRQDSMMSLADLLEERAAKSIDSSSDSLNPRGIPYWISIGASDEDGFYGGQTYDNSGNAITSVGGITPTDTDRWCNYFKDYDGPTAADTMVDAMHKVYRNIQFRAPRIVKDLDQGPLSRYQIFMDGDTIDAYEKYTRKSNENIGYDVGKFAGATAFQRVPIIWWPQLDNISSDIAGTNPIYFINFNKFQPYILRGDEFHESEPMSDVTFPDVIVTYVSISYNYICTNRRAQGLISTV